jgi:hypothetical protein
VKPTRRRALGCYGQERDRVCQGRRPRTNENGPHGSNWTHAEQFNPVVTQPAGQRCTFEKTGGLLPEYGQAKTASYPLLHC